MNKKKKIAIIVILALLIVGIIIFLLVQNSDKKTSAEKHKTKKVTTAPKKTTNAIKKENEDASANVNDNKNEEINNQQEQKDEDKKTITFENCEHEVVDVYRETHTKEEYQSIDKIENGKDKDYKCNWCEKRVVSSDGIYNYKFFLEHLSTCKKAVENQLVTINSDGTYEYTYEYPVTCFFKIKRTGNFTNYRLCRRYCRICKHEFDINDYTKMGLGLNTVAKVDENGKPLLKDY